MSTSTVTALPTSDAEVARHGSESLIERLCRSLARKDFLFLPADRTRTILNEVQDAPLRDWDSFQKSWFDLPLDPYMADGGRYRKRRHATLSALPSSRCAHLQPHQPHFQSLKYNHLNGGIARHYEPIAAEVLAGATMQSLIRLGCELFGRLAPFYPWHIEVHQFRIEAQEGGSGLPTPQGVHQDGVNYVLMVMVQRQNLVNGSTAIYDKHKIKVDEFTLQQPLDLAIVNDEHVFHGVTPIVQLSTDAPAIRDVLVITFRRKI